MTDTPAVVHLADYEPYPYRVPHTALRFDISDSSVRVTSTLDIEAGAETEPGAPLILDGVRLTLISLSLDGSPLAPEAYTVTDTSLTIPGVPARFRLETVVEIDPYHNTWLEGLYQSGEVLCTQNESEGFRKITYYPDRPDVMSSFTTTITADPKRFPCLLSNGNKIAERSLEDGRRCVAWRDPHLKPCYLFALVAGNLACVEDSFTTASGRQVTLQVYVDHGNEDRVPHTLASLKRSMKWDEETFGLEYDLDLFMIVAVDAFNYGAMENKGLNIFNSMCALANPDTATDGDYERIEAIVAHEYFHNWTGDRITLRDWFQITLKEGLTVYRDAEYTADTYSRPIKRIEDARGLRSGQFSEDAGPNAHPIQPKSYQEINNFYTSTVYNKGAEVIRMIAVLVGRDGFRKGMDRYVELYDGQAITTEDFLYAMESANGMDLTQFRRWYHQAGTPLCRLKGAHDAKAQTFTLTLEQRCGPTADGSPKEPFYFPMTLGLMGPDGQDLALQLAGEEDEPPAGGRTLVVSEPSQTFVFSGVAERPVPSLFRDFCAPVKVDYDYSREDLTFLLQHDSDPFNRYDAGQRLALQCLLDMTKARAAGKEEPPPDAVLDAFGALLQDSGQDLAFASHALVLPDLAIINQELDTFDFENTFRAREGFKQALATRYADTWRAGHEAHGGKPFAQDAAAVAARRFGNLCLDYRSYLDDGAVVAASEQYHAADNMTDRMAALVVLCASDSPERGRALDAFLERFRDDFNVMNKWFGVQGSAARHPRLYDIVCVLGSHDLFDRKNPNRLRSLYGAFAGNLPAFHEASGRGYRLIADLALEIDPVNNLVSAGFGKAFKHYARLDAGRRKLMKTELERMVDAPNISAGLTEVVGNTLKQ